MAEWRSHSTLKYIKIPRCKKGIYVKTHKSLFLFGFTKRCPSLKLQDSPVCILSLAPLDTRQNIVQLLRDLADPAVVRKIMMHRLHIRIALIFPQIIPNL